MKFTQNISLNIDVFEKKGADSFYLDFFADVFRFDVEVSTKCYCLNPRNNFPLDEVENDKFGLHPLSIFFFSSLFYEIQKVVMKDGMQAVIFRQGSAVKYSDFIVEDACESLFTDYWNFDGMFCIAWAKDGSLDEVVKEKKTCYH